ncbi:protein required for normal CLN1 and CLN2 G1 cyclin expression [Marasmius crinis-equi]|uniref:Protein required for normal CLN1 and CLN2 G1 cyclin expression n=1 Tax=Marasmius crinis-equi TaxID=585013 RepID=A0ABR3FSV5_9AGAR
MEEEFTPTGRSVDIELGGQEVITIDLDNLDPDPQDVLDLLKDGDCKVWVWTKLAGEYWRRGYLDAAETIVNAGIDAFMQIGNEDSLPPLHALKANLQLSHARRAPKILLPGAREDILPSDQKTKEQYFHEATSNLNRASNIQSSDTQLPFLTRGILQLDTRLFDEAMQTFQQVLNSKPTNIVALFGKARILYARRNYPQALQTFQMILRYSPNCQPDPRIGIGLCFWAMDNKAKAKAAWQRSLEVNPSEWAAQLLLGLESINSSKDTSHSDTHRTESFIAGTKSVESAFRLNQKNASAANALCELFIQKGNHKRATKLAERTIQFADTLTILTEGHLRSARIAHSEGYVTLASSQYQLAHEKQPKHAIAAIGLAQMQMQNDEMAGAIHTLDTLLQPPNPQKCNEAVVMLASLRAFPRPGVSSSEIEKERIKARELFERISKSLELDDVKANGHGPGGGTKLPRALVDDMTMYIEIAKLWQTESLDRTTKALKEALRISEASGSVEPRILNNLGALNHLEEKYPEARTMYEKALTTVSSMASGDAESMSTSILYNLARVYEDQGDDALAKEAYDKLLSRHPEYNDAKIRQAKLLCNINRNNDAHDLLKQALTSQSSNLNLRAFYTYFLIQSNLPKLAKDFVFATLKEYDRHDVYSLCAAGWIMYHQSRESRDTSPEGAKERKRGFQRSADFYEKALQLDPCCAFAAQGLAIVTAEDALGSLVSGVTTADEVQKRMNNAREALDIFAKVRESISDGSVYLNMGHCYYARDEFDRAIESYETASVRFYKGQNIPVLLCLCRSWYAKAMKDQSYPLICRALECAQKALHIQPNDKAILYNIAMIQQKSAEMLFSLKPEKRKLEDLTRVIEQATHAQKLFASLALDPASVVPYSRDIADQRRKYGDNMLKKGDDQMAAQRNHEQETQARLDAARAKRQEEREKQEAAERERMEALRQEAEKLAEERRQAREKAMEWTREVRMDSDDEKEKKPKKTRRPKPESAAVSGDESEPPKKKRRGKLRKAGGEEGDGEGEAMFTDDEDTEKPTKKRPKKRVVRDDDEEEATAPSRKKQYKSKEVLSDTDDEEMDG